MTYDFDISFLICHLFQVGLCHISELSDEHTDNIEGKYRAGDRVAAKVLRVSSRLSGLNIIILILSLDE